MNGSNIDIWVLAMLLGGAVLWAIWAGDPETSPTTSINFEMRRALIQQEDV